MDHCENGCPCKDFDCDLALNVTDPVYGLESIGIMEPIGQSIIPIWNFQIYNLNYLYFQILFTGPIYNGECIDITNDLQRDGTIYAHNSYEEFYNSTHVQDCSNFCLKHNPKKAHTVMTQNEDQKNNSTIEETTGRFEYF